MPRLLLALALVAPAAFAQAPAPSVAVFPLGTGRLPSGFSKDDTAALQKDFVRIVRRSDVLVPDTASLELALKELKRSDCDREDACLQALAQRAQTLYALHGSIEYTLEGAVVAIGRVVRDDGKLVAGPVTTSLPKGPDAFKEVARVALTRMLGELKLKELPSARPVADVTPPTKPDVGPPQPDTHIVPPPPPPPVVVEAPSLRRPVGYTVAGVGAALAITGGVLAGLANAGVGGLGIQEGVVPRDRLEDFQALRTQETAGWILLGAGVAAAGVGLGIALTAPSAPVTVAPVAAPGGAGVIVQGSFP